MRRSNYVRDAEQSASDTSANPMTGWPRFISGPLTNPRFRLLLWLVVGLAGWLGLLAIGAQLVAATPPKAGFDLELLLDAGRRVATGQSPYNGTTAGGGTLQAEALFYSYPPPLAQAMSFLARVPSSIALVAWGVGATGAMALVARGLEVREAGAESAPGFDRSLVVPLVCVAPFIFPFAIAILFGNLDAWFPAIYGAILLGALVGDRLGWGGAGAAVAVASMTKLHPGSLGAWLLVRGWRDRRQVTTRKPAEPQFTGGLGSDGSGTGAATLPGPWFALVSSLLVLLVVVAASVAIWGVDPWRDYLAVVRAGTGAALIDPRNVGPAAQLAGLIGLDERAVRLIQVAVAVGAVLLSGWVAWKLSDTVESLAWASVASLVTLPVTWFHYPVVLIPFAVAALARAERQPVAGRVRWLVVGAVAASGLAIAAPVLVWVSVALVLTAVIVSTAATPPAHESV